MTSEDSNPRVTILDVGHGNAAVLSCNQGFILFDAGPKGHLHRYLMKKRISTIEAMLLSHADLDHVGGAISVLLDPALQVKRVYINPDPSKKKNHSFQQLRLAILESQRVRGTLAETQITTALTGRLEFGEVSVQVLHPPPDLAMGGVCGSDLSGKTISPNALSTVLRVMYQGRPKILFGGDLEKTCLSIWKERMVNAESPILMFPHHGGLPGTSDPSEIEAFASDIALYVRPEVVGFSIDRTRYALPRQEVVDSVIKVLSAVRFVCTQLPIRYAAVVTSTDAGHWILHRIEDENRVHFKEGNIQVLFTTDGYQIIVGEAP